MNDEVRARIPDYANPRSFAEGCQIQLAKISALKPLRSALKRTQTTPKRTETTRKRTHFVARLRSGISPL